MEKCYYFLYYTHNLIILLKVNDFTKAWFLQGREWYSDKWMIISNCEHSFVYLVKWHFLNKQSTSTINSVGDILLRWRHSNEHFHFCPFSLWIRTFNQMLHLNADCILEYHLSTTWGVGDDLDIIKCNKNIPVNVMEFQTLRETIGKFTPQLVCVYKLKSNDFLFLKTQHFLCCCYHHLYHLWRVTNLGHSLTIETSTLLSPYVTFEMLELWCKINIFSLIVIWEGPFIAVFTVREVVCNFHVFSLVSKACEQNMMEWGWNGNKLVVDFTAWPSHYFHR